MPETGPIHGDAATVVILRDGPDGVEVLLLERHGRGSFAGAWAFPGGTVDPEDGLIGAVGVAGTAGASGTAGAGWTPSAASPARAGGAASAASPARAVGAASAASPARAVGAASADDAGASPHDAPLAVRRAAVRETREETRLRLTEDALVGLSVWVPPQRAEKRLRTWFFVAADPGGDVVLNDGEHVAYAWVTPAVALERHGAGEMVLFPPTWVTLHGLLGAETAALAIADAASRAPELYASLQLFAGDGQIEAVLWAGDAQYGNEAAMGPARHRLQMSSLPWVYERSE